MPFLSHSQRSPQDNGSFPPERGHAARGQPCTATLTRTSSLPAAGLRAGTRRTAPGALAGREGATGKPHRTAARRAQPYPPSNYVNHHHPPYNEEATCRQAALPSFPGAINSARALLPPAKLPWWPPAPRAQEATAPAAGGATRGSFRNCLPVPPKKIPNWVRGRLAARSGTHRCAVPAPLPSPDSEQQRAPGPLSLGGQGQEEKRDPRSSRGGRQGLSAGPSPKNKGGRGERLPSPRRCLLGGSRGS